MKSSFYRLIGLCLAVGCGAEVSPGADAGPDIGSDLGPDVSGDVQADTAAMDANADSALDAVGDTASDSISDAGSDAGADAALPTPETLLLLAYGGATCNQNPCAQGFTYRAGGSWSRTSLGESGYQQTGGGLVTARGRGWAAYRPGAGSAIYLSGWEPVTGWEAGNPLAGTSVNAVSRPIASETQVMFAVADVAMSSIAFYALGQGGAPSVMNEAVGLGDNNSVPALATVGTDVLLLTAVRSQGSVNYEYVYKVRRNGVWSSASTIAGLSHDFDQPASPLLVSLPNDQALAVVATGGFNTRALQALVYANGLWSAPVLVASDAYENGSGSDRPVVATTLSDGRIAVAYQTENNAVKIGYYAAGSFGEFVTTPNVTVGGGSPISIAPGISGAVLELLYLDSEGHVQHTRLTGNVWSTPTLVSDTSFYSFVSAASL